MFASLWRSVVCYTLAMLDPVSGTELLPTPEQTPHTASLPEVTEESGVEADERAWEGLPETADDILHAERQPPLETVVEAAGGSAGQAVTDAQKDEVTIEVEKVLEDGMGPFYAALPEDARPLFKKKGEEASLEISDMVRNFRVQASRVLQLVYLWLKTIPGVNKFFLEQEAKIKTDRIIQLAEERRREAYKT